MRGVYTFNFKYLIYTSFRIFLIFKFVAYHTSFRKKISCMNIKYFLKI